MRTAPRSNNPTCLFFVLLLICASAASAAAPEAKLLSGRPFVPGYAANGESTLGDVTPDGRFVAVTSSANNFHAGDVDTNGSNDVYLLDRSNGDWQLISRRFGNPSWSGGSQSTAKALTPDGRFVLYESDARDLLATPQASGSSQQVYLYDRSSATTVLISHAFGQTEIASNSNASADAISADGRFVVFTSNSTDLIVGSTGSPQSALFLHDRSTGVTELVSHSSTSPTAFPNHYSTAIELSADGRFLLFSSFASDLVSGMIDGAGTNDVFLYDRQNSSITLISHHPNQPGQAMLGYAADLSADGRYVLLSSTAALQAGMTDANGSGLFDCYLYDRQTSTARLVSHNATSTSTSGNAGSFCLGMSDDGAFVYLSSGASDLVSPFSDNNGTGNDMYVFERATGTLTLASHNFALAGSSGNGNNWSLADSVSPDGRFLLYSSEATDLEAGIVDTNNNFDSYLYDRLANSSTLVSRRGSTGVAVGSTYVYSATGFDDEGGVFFDYGQNLQADPAADSNGSTDVFRFAPAEGQPALVSAVSIFGREALGASAMFSISESERWALSGGFIYDLITENRELVGHAAGSPSVPANGSVSAVSIDSASRFVLLDSTATNLAIGITDPNSGNPDVFLYDRTLKTASLVSRVAGSPSVAADRASNAFWLSADGQRMILYSQATNLLPGGIPDPGFNSQYYFFDRPTDQMSLLSHRHDSPSQPSNRPVNIWGISSDERFLLFTSEASDLVPNFSGAPGSNVYLYDRLSSQATLVSHKAGFPNVGGDSVSYSPIASGDFRYVYFNSVARDLGPNPDKTQVQFVYRWDRLTGANQLVVSFPSCHSFFGSRFEDISLDGRYLLVSSPCILVPGDWNNSLDTYVFDRIAGHFELISHLPGNPKMSKGNSFGLELSDDGRRVIYADLGLVDFHFTAYDRQTQQEVDLRLPAFDDGTLLRSSKVVASRDGNLILLGMENPRAVPYDANRVPEIFMMEQSALFANGFESGDTTAWSLTLP